MNAMHALNDLYDPLDFTKDEIEAMGPKLKMAYYEAKQAAASFRAAEDRASETEEGFRYDWSELNELVRADLAVKFWAGVVAHSSPSEDQLQITEEVLDSFVKDAARALLRNYGGTSTDMASNFRDKVEKDFYARIVDRFGDYDV